ncbi:MAG TPA: nucleoside-diphosphate sugar epimerase/dehydratase [Sphingobium sp.]
MSATNIDTPPLASALSESVALDGANASPAPLRSLIDRIGTGAATLLSRSPWVRILLLGALDMAAVAGALLLALSYEGAAVLATRPVFTLLFSTIAVVGFFLTGLYQRSWRFLSFGDGLFLTASVAIGLGAAWAAGIATGVLSGRIGSTASVIAIHYTLTLLAMASMRVARRGVREYVRHRLHAPHRAGCKRALLLGDTDWARAMIELIHADDRTHMEVVGVLTPDGRDRTLKIANVPILGTPAMFSAIVAMLEVRNRRPTCIILRDDGRTLEKRDFATLVSTAERLKLDVARAGDPWSQMAKGKPRVDLQYLPLAELLGRPEIQLERGYVSRMVTGRRIMVTGAGGTIGSELVRQLAPFKPSEIVLLDHAEYNLYAIDMEARESFPDILFHPALCSVRQMAAVKEVFERFRPEIVFHAAALKHVPMVEENPCAGVHTNVIGTRNVANAACEYGARAMVQVSTDKAVNPVGMMGATKRAGELYCQALDLIGEDDANAPRFMTVRFGNVLGSSGSLIPLFARQLAQGKPLTVTHPDIERFFMTVKEAVQLILQSSAEAMHNDRGRGAIFVLDMGKPIKIVDIARRMIRLAGLEPDIDVAIQFVGLRPGEKLYEELFDSSEERLDSSIAGIFEARPIPVPLAILSQRFGQLERLVLKGDAEGVCRQTHDLIKAPPIAFDRKAMLHDLNDHVSARATISATAMGA